jgi:hypothetical protein
MATNKIYVKQGKKGYKEVRMINEIEKALEKKLKTDPSFTFEPAQDKDDLKALYDRIVVEDTEFEDVPGTAVSRSLESETETKHKEFKKGMEETVKQTEPSPIGSVGDPFNEEEPNIRDYVLKDEFPDKKEAGRPGAGSFDEPVTFNESFNIPGDEDSPAQAGSESEQKTSGSGEAKQKDKKSDPVNPDFSNMSSKDQNKSTKRLAKAIVFAYCTLVEKAGQWIAIKDITEEKLFELQASGELSSESLDIIFSLDGRTQQTVGQFFEQLREDGVKTIKFEEEDKEEMAELLAEVLKKRGIAPTVEQNLIMAVVMSTLKVGLAAMAISNAAKSVVNQLRTPGSGAPQSEYQAPPQPTRPQKMEDFTAEATKAASNQRVPEEPTPQEAEVYNKPEPVEVEAPMIGTEIATKE